VVDLGSSTELSTKKLSVIEGFRSDVHGVSALGHSVESGPGWVRVRWYVLHPRGLSPTPHAELDRGELRLRASLTGVEAVVGGSDLVTYETELRHPPPGHLHITGPHRLDRSVDVVH